MLSAAGELGGSVVGSALHQLYGFGWSYHKEPKAKYPYDRPPK